MGGVDVPHAGRHGLSDKRHIRGRGREAVRAEPDARNVEAGESEGAHDAKARGRPSPDAAPSTSVALELMQLRVARHTGRLEEAVAFYRDGLGLPEIGRFSGHHGYDGVFLEIPGSGAHLELTTGGAHAAPEPHPETLLVLYVGDDDAVREIARRLQVEPVAPANPYWAEHGVTYEDPDGFRVVLVPAPWKT